MPDPVVSSSNSNVDPYAEYVTLLLHMDGINGSTTFIDNSYVQNTVTANGNAQISTAQSKFGGASAYFDGNGDSISFADLQLGTGSFTVEMWFKTNSGNQYAQLIGNESNGGSAGFTLLINNNSPSGGQVAVYSNGSLVVQSSSGDWSDDAWHHVALVRSDSNVTLYLDGISYGTGTNSNSWDGGNYYIGTNAVYSGRDLDGYIDDLRITKGVARYAANFTPPTAALPDPFTPGPTAALLLHFDGTNGSTTFTDSSPNALTVTANGNAQISTAQSKFGGASGYFDGSSDLGFTPTDATRFGTGDFTVEFWLYITGSPNDNQVVISFCAWPNTSGFVINYSNTTLGVFTGGFTDSFFYPRPASNSWHHCAVCRTSGSVVLYIDGVETPPASTTGSLAGNYTDGLQYVGRPTDVNYYKLNGYIDELRITKGVARYTANFTPPTAPFPNG